MNRYMIGYLRDILVYVFKWSKYILQFQLLTIHMHMTESYPNNNYSANPVVFNAEYTILWPMVLELVYT